MSNPRMSITFSQPQADFLNREANKLGISIATVVGRIIDNYRLQRSEVVDRQKQKRSAEAIVRDQKRAQAIAEVRRNMDASGRYTHTPHEAEIRRRDMEIYNRVIGGETKTQVAKSVGLSSVDIPFNRAFYIIDTARRSAENPESIPDSPLTIRLKNVLKDGVFTKFRELDGASRKMLINLPNCGKSSVDILEAYLEFRFPQYRLTD
jgi:hypothetical protein